MGEREILLNSTVIMLAVVVPVILMAVAFSWWFRTGNTSAKRRLDWTYSGPMEVLVWGVPAAVIMFLGGIAWIGSHDLDPGKPIESANAPLEVQVVSLDWKWLFIYPELGVATVNRLVVPANRPLAMELTSGSVMNSFFVPQLGSQIYVMANMGTRLHLMADHPGTFPGFSAHYSGVGFSSMRFNVDAMPQADFDRWLVGARKGSQTLDTSAYGQLAKPGTKVTEASFAKVSPGLFQNIMSQHVDDAKAPQGAASGGASSTPVK